MDALKEIVILLVKTGTSVFMFLVWLRFLLQVAGADFYNPMSQFVVRATSPLLNPLRRAVPGFFGLDIAALVLIVLIKLIQLAAVVHLDGLVATPALLVVTAVFDLLQSAIDFFFWLILGTVILSWVAMASGGVNPGLMPLLQIAEIVLAPCRRLLPNLGGFDLSPIIAFLALQIFGILLNALEPQVLSALAG
ncbi:YggT family protein [Amnimonas aquatica]|uniref:YggT family protein n=1 Tax=Amnimonas aquatica TaxID=2094561 RepID=A0A2P6ASL8_9GAMM|nr:YggT family protein [Amnimonas aquatica]PQA42900.1 YggT family protein [Amnimonas aquatica]